jgi:PST family polysaccharide transporter
MTGARTKTLAIKGATWATFGVGLQRLVQTLALLVLARILVPEDFGLVAVAVLVLNFANRAKTLGLHTALVQHPGDDQRAPDTCFIINGCLTIATLGVILAVCPLVSKVFDPRAGSLLALLSIRLIPQALAAVPSTLAVKSLDFRKQALIQAAEGLVSAAGSIILATAGWGPWALVAGSLAGSFAAAVLWWIRPVWVPQWQFDRTIASQLVHAGVRIWSSGNLAYLIDSANRLMIGSMLGLARLGHYEIVSRIVHTPIQTILSIHDRVAISAFCRERDDRDRIGRWFLRLSGMMMILTALVAGPLLCFPEVLIPTFFGRGWEAAIDPARALAVFALLAPLVSSPAVYIAAGRTGLLLAITTVRTVVTIGALFAAAHHSLTAVCVVESLAAVVFAPVNLVLVARLTGLKAKAMVSTLSVPAIGLAAFAAVAAVCRPVVRGFFPPTGFGALLGLLIPSTIALVLAVFALRPHLVKEIRSLISETAGTE